MDAFPQKPELLAPAGSFEAALAAFQYGADAVYLGLPKFSARADAQNLTPEQLKMLLAYAKTFSPAKKIYVTLNTLIREREWGEVREVLEALEELSPDAVIVQDLGVAAILRRNFPRLALHASTQLAAHNIEGVKALKALGFSRVVTARELTLQEIADIRRLTGVEIEIFVHGALCYSISGLCLFSAMEFGRSGNRGRCAYCCRQAFDGEYPFSMRDLALAPSMDAVLRSGADSLKIEGRMKSPLYVACVCDYYRRKRDGLLSPEEERRAVQDLQTVFSRPWTELYAHGDKCDAQSIIDPISVGHRGAKIGVSLPARRRGTLRFVSDRELEKFDGIQIDLPQGGRPYGFSIRELYKFGERGKHISLPAGSEVELPLPPDAPTIPCSCDVFCSSSQAVKRRFTVKKLRPSELPAGKRFDLKIILSAEGATAKALGVAVKIELPLTPAKAPEKTFEVLKSLFSRTGGTDWQLGDFELEDIQGLYLPASKANEMRRALIEQLDMAQAGSKDGAKLQGEEQDEILTKPGRAPRCSCKFRIEQQPCDYDFPADGELVLAVNDFTNEKKLFAQAEAWRALGRPVRIALPFWMRNEELPVVRELIAKFKERGFHSWEVADLSGLKMVREAGLEEISCDWTCYAFNRKALANWLELGVEYVVLSPELDTEERAELCATGHCQSLVQQHTPLFFSVTAPCMSRPFVRGGVLKTRNEEYRTEKFGALYVLTRLRKTVWPAPENSPVRYDFSWS